MTKKAVFTKQFVLAEIEATYWTAKMHKHLEQTVSWVEAVKNRDDALIRIDAIKPLIEREGGIDVAVRIETLNEEFAKAEIDATFWHAKLDRAVSGTTDYFTAVLKRDDALRRIRSCKFLLDKKD